MERADFFIQAIPLVLKQTHAAVPTEDRIVITRRTDFLGLGEALKGLLEKRQQRMRCPANPELRFGAPLVQDSGVVMPLVTVAQLLEDFFHFARAVGGVTAELIGDREAEQAERELMLGFDGQDIATDRLGLLRLVEIAVEFNFGSGLGDPSFLNRFSCVFYGPPSC